MDTSPHDLSSLLSQLGLASGPSAMAAFLVTYRLENDMALLEAPFWNEAQVQFLREALQDDSDWAEAVDHLAVLLSWPG